MSGRATGWVGLHGPRPDDVDRNGKPYGQRARGLRMVLLAVADAANVDGARSHPGIDNVAAFALYSRAQTIRLLGELVAEGWLQITEGGRGRGHATVYRIAMEKRSHDETQLEPEKVSSGVDKRSHLGPEGSHPDETPTVLTTENEQREPPAPERLIATDVWERSDPRPATPFVGIMQIAKKLLAAGHDADAITEAMLAVPTISIRWVEGELNRGRRRPPRRRAEKVDHDREAPGGRIVL